MPRRVDENGNQLKRRTGVKRVRQLEEDEEEEVDSRLAPVQKRHHYRQTPEHLRGHHGHAGFGRAVIRREERKEDQWARRGEERVEEAFLEERLEDEFLEEGGEEEEYPQGNPYANVEFVGTTEELGEYEEVSVEGREGEDNGEREEEEREMQYWV